MNEAVSDEALADGRIKELREQRDHWQRELAAERGRSARKDLAVIRMEKQIDAMRAEVERLTEALKKITKTTTWSDAIDIADTAVAATEPT